MRGGRGALRRDAQREPPAELFLRRVAERCCATRRARALQTDHEIQLCVRYIAQEINKRFVGKDILLCAVLKGAYFFLADLTRLLTIPYTTYFVEASSYGESQKQVRRV